MRMPLCLIQKLLLDAFAKAYMQLGLALKIKNTQILHQPSLKSMTPVLPPDILVDNTRLNNVDHFTSACCSLRQTLARKYTVSSACFFFLNT